MKNSYQKLLEDVRKTLLTPAEQGISPEEVKQVIIYILSPYFENKDVLEESAIPYLAPEAVNVSRINKDIWARNMFVNVLGDYHQAKKLDSNKCFSGFVTWQKGMLQSSSEFVSIINLNRGIEDLSLDDFQYEVFRVIGSLIESNLQIFLKLLLLQIRIRRSKKNPEQGLDTLKLGSVIDELCTTSGYDELFAPPPWKIRLHHWRNIAQHLNHRVEKDQIICDYTEGNLKKSIVLTREDLLNVLKQVQSILAIIRGASSIFLIDYQDQIRPYFASINLEVRRDLHVFSLASSLATQGFDLRDLSFDEKSVTAILQDVTDTPTDEREDDYRRKRIIHSSQLVLAVWSYFQMETVVVKYFDERGNLRCTSTCKGDDCGAYDKGDIEIEEFAKRVSLQLATIKRDNCG